MQIEDEGENEDEVHGERKRCGRLGGSAVRGIRYAGSLPQSGSTMKTLRRGFIVHVLVTLVPALGALAQTPPPSDNFDNRTVVTGSVVTLTGSLAGATVENGESAPEYYGFTNAPSGGSVWWSWTAPTSSTVVILMTTVSRNRAAVWTGTNLNSLSLGIWSSSPKPAGRYLRFDAVAGAAY